MVMWRLRFQKNSLKRGAAVLRDSTAWSCEDEGLRRAVSKEGWPLVRSSCSWKCEEYGYGRAVSKELLFSKLQNTTEALLCHIHLPVCLWITDPYNSAPKKNTSHGNEVLPQDTTHLMQRPSYQRGSPCQDPAVNLTARRPPDHRK